MVKRTLLAVLVAGWAPVSWAAPPHGRPSAADFHVVRPLLKLLRRKGFELRRVRSADPNTLVKPWHTALPVDPAGSNVRGQQISVAKGRPRSSRLPTGANSALSSFLHEAGHALYDSTHGKFQPRPPRGPLDEHHPMRVAERLARELQANNTALQALEQLGATAVQIAAFITSRTESYRTYLELPPAVSAHPKYARYYSTLSALWAAPGHTPSYSLAKDLPSLFVLAAEVSGATTNKAPTRKE